MSRITEERRRSLARSYPCYPCNPWFDCVSFQLSLAFLTCSVAPVFKVYLNEG